MPITLIDIIKQQNRDATSGDFFFLLDSSDINFKVQGIQEDTTLDPTLTLDYKYILRDASNLNANFGTITGVGNNDIVRYNGSDFEILLDASNKQDGTIVFNEGDSKFYGFNGTDWQELGSGAAGGVTGATGDTGPTGPTGESIASVGISFGRLIVTKNTGETLDAGYVVGPTGPTGESYIGVSGPDFSRIGINALNFVQGTNVTIGTTYDGATASITISVININAGDY